MGDVRRRVRGYCRRVLVEEGVLVDFCFCVVEFRKVSFMLFIKEGEIR